MEFNLALCVLEKRGYSFLLNKDGTYAVTYNQDGGLLIYYQATVHEIINLAEETLLQEKIINFF